jgi:hypothetical protein
MAEHIKSMMEIQSEGYPTNAAERLEQALKDACYAEQARNSIVADMSAGAKVCRVCRHSKGANYRFPIKGCPHRREIDRRLRQRSRRR